MDNSKVDIGIPPGKYEIVIGDSYKKGPDRKDFHTLKCKSFFKWTLLRILVDFKPKSVATEQEAYIAFNQKEDVQVLIWL